jgi:hypothetical protein
MFRRMPEAAIVTTRDEPPAETNGRGTPVMGRTPTQAPTLMNAWMRIQVVIPVANNIPKRSRA